MTDIKIYSSLEKIFDDCVPAGEITGLSMLRNEILSFQIVFDTDDGCSFSVESDIPEFLGVEKRTTAAVNEDGSRSDIGVSAYISSATTSSSSAKSSTFLRLACIRSCSSREPTMSLSH